MGVAQSTTENGDRETDHRERKERVDAKYSNANNDATNVTLSSGITDYYANSSKKIADDSVNYASSINPFIADLDKEIGKALTDTEKDEYIKIKQNLLDSQNKVAQYSTIASDSNIANTANYNSVLAKQLIDPANNALTNTEKAKNELWNLHTRDSIESKKEKESIANANAQFINDLYSKGFPEFDIKGSHPLEMDALRVYTTAESNKNLALTEKENAVKEYGIYTELIKNYANSPWLIEQIAKYDTDISNATVKKTKIDEPEKTKDTTDKTTTESKILAAIKGLKSSKSKGSAYEQGEDEIEKLKADLEKCSVVETGLNKTKSDLVRDIAAENPQAQLNLIEDKKLEEAAAKETLRLTKIRLEDLSGDIFDLSGEILNITKILTDDEKNIDQLRNYIKELNDTIDNLTETNYSNKVFNNQNLLKLNKNVDQDLQYIFSDLKTKNINPKLLYSKIKYREIEKQKLSNTNKILDILFYCFYFAFIIIIIFTRNAKIEHFLIYIFIGIIPFVYPFLFKNIKYILHLFHLDGNKNAFIENQNTFDSYNI